MEIKFCGKRLDNGEWAYGCLTRYSNHMSYITVDLIENEVHEVLTATVGQFTNEKDDEQKDMYEGDVLAVECPNCEETHIVVIERQGCTLCVDVCGEDYDTTAITWAIRLWDNYGADYKIIGNIHEHPHLLEPNHAD